MSCRGASGFNVFQRENKGLNPTDIKGRWKELLPEQQKQYEDAAAQQNNRRMDDPSEIRVAIKRTLLSNEQSMALLNSRTGAHSVTITFFDNDYFVSMLICSYSHSFVREWTQRLES